jgi:hypothetical protein
MRQVQPTLGRVVEVLARLGETSFECEDGSEVRIRITRAYYLSLYGAADRRAVSAGMRMVTEHVIDGHYCRLEVVVERAVYDTRATARVQLEAVELLGEPLPEMPAPLRPHLRLIAA